jgi:hypothetical protein
MAKSSERLTKARVLEQVNYLRDRIREYSRMSQSELEQVYRQVFRGDTLSPEPRDIANKLLMSATYYLTNVLNLE